MSDSTRAALGGDTPAGRLAAVGSSLASSSAKRLQATALSASAAAIGHVTADGAATDVREWNAGVGGTITSFGEDRDGELYVISHGGSVGKLVKAP